MIPLFLTLSIPFTSPQFCTELAFELDSAVKRGQIEQLQADQIADRCLETYTKGS